MQAASAERDEWRGRLAELPSELHRLRADAQGVAERRARSERTAEALEDASARAAEQAAEAHARREALQVRRQPSAISPCPSSPPLRSS
jgi:hypothetical protein